MKKETPFTLLYASGTDIYWMEPYKPNNNNNNNVPSSNHKRVYDWEKKEIINERKSNPNHQHRYV